MMKEKSLSNIGKQMEKALKFKPIKIDTSALRDILTPRPLPKVEFKEIYFPSAAESCWNNLRTIVSSFEEELDDTQEIGVKIASDNGGKSIYIETFGYIDPDIITFSGVGGNGNPVRLIQNISQLNFTLEVLPRQREERRKIGFIRYPR